MLTGIDEKTLEKMRNCTKAEFPICLDHAITKMFGEDGKKTVDRIVMTEKFERPEITSPKDIWKLYEKYIESSSLTFGGTVAKVFEYQSLIEMESMLCTKCPLYECEVERRKNIKNNNY